MVEERRKTPFWNRTRSHSWQKHHSAISPDFAKGHMSSDVQVLLHSSWQVASEFPDTRHLGTLTSVRRDLVLRSFKIVSTLFNQKTPKKGSPSSRLASLCLACFLFLFVFLLFGSVHFHWGAAKSKVCCYHTKSRDLCCSSSPNSVSDRVREEAGLAASGGAAYGAGALAGLSKRVLGRWPPVWTVAPSRPG